MSRSCLRESLQHLQAEELITVIPHKGPEVTSIPAIEERDADTAARLCEEHVRHAAESVLRSMQAFRVGDGVACGTTPAS